MRFPPQICSRRCGGSVIEYEAFAGQIRLGTFEISNDLADTFLRYTAVLGNLVDRHPTQIHQLPLGRRDARTPVVGVLLHGLGWKGHGHRILPSAQCGKDYSALIRRAAGDFELVKGRAELFSPRKGFFLSRGKRFIGVGGHRHG